ncbi:sigma 54-interacting transcriptional regulator [Sorangium sp. So ce367]|uniref:sigma 54-interacting transcriptional regulator n=1 Tax=Sorangium sp. So ce367 TaxID=3133305 RepID=UPI003F63CE5C
MGSVAAARVPSVITSDSGGFRALDERVRDAASRGVLHVHGQRPVLDAVCSHLARRARVAGRSLISAAHAADRDPWRDLALRCAVTSADPAAAAQGISAAAQGAILLVAEGEATSWGSLVLEEVTRLIAEGSCSALVIVCSDGAMRPWTSALTIDGIASPDDLHRFWEAFAVDAERRVVAKIERLDALEGWCSAVLAAPPEQRPARQPPSREAARLLDRLALSQRPWPCAQLRQLAARRAEPGPGDAACQGVAQELAALGLIEVDDRGWVAARRAVVDPANVDREDVFAIAEALEEQSSDPWSLSRASELLASLGQDDRAEAAAMLAISSVGEPSARADFWQRWARTMRALSGGSAASGERLLRAAELALRLGDIEFAIDFSSAAQRERETFAALLVRGRATSARGDLTTAAMVLSRALSLAATPEERARGAVEMAELCCKTGDLAAAKARAEEGLAGAGEIATRLQARNILGKLLLAQQAWAEAELHFAADAWEAACAGEHVSELRARLNRAIALLSSGRLDEARTMLAGVLEEGERRGERAATGYALTNLAVIAHLKHEYPEALRLFERAIEIFRRIGDKVALVNLITNLAEIRLQLGLIEEAEQALAFARKACGHVIPGVRITHVAYVAAQIHLECRRTVDAWSELTAAFACGAGSKLGECYAIAARIALHDGDLLQAGQMIQRARAEATSDRHRAEIALLEAMCSRAAGAPFGKIAAEALALSRRAHSHECALEAHVLLHHASSAGDRASRASEDEPSAGRSHLEAAIDLRDRIAESLPPEISRKFLARRSFAELARLEACARSAAEAEPRGCELCGSSACAGCARGAARAPRPASAGPAIKRMVGTTPALLSLIHQIEKVGASDATVLIHGESGTGKELVAEAIHEVSARRAGPLIKVNCAALVETLLLSELFGHEKGSFTGAASRRRGRFELAEGGTLFLDEIGDISPRTQVALLRVLQDKTFERVGGVTPLRANVRILCATHRDLRAMVARGEFREDLYYRLRQVVLEVPALRHRPRDLPAIAAAILERIGGERGVAPKRLSSRAIEALSRHSWPGNVRELENALRAAAIFADGEVIDLEDFTTNVEGLRELDAAELVSAPMTPRAGMHPALESLKESSRESSRDAPREPSSGPRASAPDQATLMAHPPSMPVDRTPLELAYAHVRGGVSLSDMKREIERECIARALDESRGNITRAAVLLGMKRPRLSQLVKQYGFGGTSED